MRQSDDFRAAYVISINPLYTCDFLMRTFSKSEYSDEMQHYEAFYQCLH